MKKLITGGCSFSSGKSDLKGFEGNPNDKRTWVTYSQHKYKFKRWTHVGLGAQGNEIITQRLLYAINESIKQGHTDLCLGVMWSEIKRVDLFSNDVAKNMEGSNGNMVWINNIRTNTLKSKYREWNCTINNGWIRSGGDILDEVWWRSKEQRNWFINYRDNFYNDEYMFINTLKNIILIQNICEKHNIKYLMFTMDEIFKNHNIEKYPNASYLWDMIDWNKFLFYEKKYGLYEYTKVNDLEFWVDGIHPQYTAHSSFIDYFDKDIKRLWKLN